MLLLDGVAGGTGSLPTGADVVLGQFLGCSPHPHHCLTSGLYDQKASVAPRAGAELGEGQR